MRWWWAVVAPHDPRPPRGLHPGAWWLWAIGLAVAASRTNNPVLLVLICLVTAFVVAARRTDAPWARAYPMFVCLALVVLGLRVVLQAVMSKTTQGTHVIVRLPELVLPTGQVAVKLGGVVTWEAVALALYAGGQLATILICVGAANALASPRRLLALAPAALYEVQVATVVALTFAPQLVTDARRIRRARRLRGRRFRWRDAFGTTAMPVLESALDRSVHLAAAMDARGYGRAHHLSAARRRTISVLSLTGTGGLAVGLYGLMSASLAPGLSTVVVIAATMAVVASLLVGRAHTTRTRYRPDPWALPEWVVAGAGIVVAAVMVGASMHGAGGLTMPSALAVPALHPLPLGAILLGLLPALAAPPPPGPATDVGAAARPSPGRAGREPTREPAP